ncbi:MAG: hypothetical protein J1F02_03185 [Lachnospiraceae bacterium]|nr:hypothetical protein [Lachnospiraceae bacterium]
MKKNILTIVIMAATLMNLILTIVLIFSVMPAMNKTGNLIDKVASVIDLEIDDKNEQEEYTIEDLVTFPIQYESNQTINLQKDPGDSTAHYAQLSGMVISFNPKAEDYDDIYASVTTNTVYVEDIVKATIGEYSLTTYNDTAVKEEALKRIQERYNTKCIVDISLTGLVRS